MSQQQPPYGQDPQQQPYGQDPQQPYGYDNPHQSGSAYPGGGMYSGRPPKRGGRGGKITFFIGLGLLVIGIVVTIIGAIAAFGWVSDLAEGGSGFTDSAQVDAPADTGYVIMAQNPQGTPSCDVSSPSGSPVSLDTSMTTTTNDGSVEVVLVGSFQTGEAGTYTLNCSGAQSFMYGQMDITQVGLSSLGLIAGIFVGFIGFVVTVIGLIVWLVGRQKVIY